MIGIAMEKWPDDALRRVVDAPVERWRGGDYVRPCGSGCLVGHAAGIADARLYVDEFDELVEALSGETLEVEYRFDEMCERNGIPRTVRTIKQRALAILLRRHPLDAKIAVLRAEVS